MYLRNNTARLALISLGIFIVFVLLRLIGLGKFVTVDEPAWTLLASNFYLALSWRQFEKTLIDYGYGVTTLWILALAFLLYFPEYRVLGKYTDKYWQVDELLHKYHKLPLTLLVRGRLISVLVIAGMLVVSFLLLDLLAGLFTALVVILTIALDPFFLGHSRLLNHEGLMAACILITLLAELVYLYRRRQARYLILSGAAFAVALLAKVSALAVFSLVGLVFFVSLLEEWKGSKTLIRYAGRLALWVFVVASVYTLLWPGMWVDPGTTLNTVFGNAFSNALLGGRLASTQGLSPEIFALDTGGIVYFLKLIFLKTTPVVWLGVILAIAGLLVKKVYPMPSMNKKLVVYFGLLAALFVFMFGVAKGRNSAHYVLTSFVSLDVVAGVGLAWGYGWLAARAPIFRRRAIQVAVLAGVLLLHGVGALPQYPYFYTYTNPVARWLVADIRDPVAGYGEGLELAGAYLTGKPDAKDLKAVSWYAAGPFSYYFPGTAYHLPIGTSMSSETVERIKESDYLVIYSTQQKSRNMPAKLLKALQPIPPEKVIWLNGREYIQIYNVDDFSEAFFEAVVD